jgi:hypothetical protein
MAISSVWSTHTHTIIPHSLTNYPQQLHHKLPPTASLQITPSSFTNYPQQLHHKLPPAASPNYPQQLHHKLPPTASLQITPSSFTNYPPQLHYKLRPAASGQTSSFRFRHDTTDRKRQRGKQKCGPPVFTGIHRSSRMLQTQTLCCPKTTVWTTQNWNTLQPEHNLSLKKWCG